MPTQSRIEPVPETLASRRDDNLRRLFRPKSVVVIGASTDPSKAGSQALQSLLTFKGQVVAVHPRETSLQGYQCYSEVAALPRDVDLAILAIPAKSCPKVVADLAAQGVGGVFIISGGFGETGAEGERLQVELAEICHRTGIRLLGPNTSGFVAPHVPLQASFVPGVEQLAPGRVAVIAQSGGVNLSIAFLLEQLGEGVSLAVGLGNAIDVGSADALAMLADDPQTTAIALHLEGVSDGRKLYDTLRAVSRRKPVVALVAGKSDIGDFAVSHTGNLLGSRQRSVAALEQAGVVVVDSTEELAQAAIVLSRARLPPKSSTNAAIITGQAGPGLLIADAVKSAGVHIPELAPATVEVLNGLLPPMTFLRNPIDTGRPGPSFPLVVEAAAKDSQIDVVLVFGLNEPSVLDPVAALGPALTLGKPVIFGSLGTRANLATLSRDLQDGGIIGVLGPERLALGAIVLAADAKAQFLLSQTAAEAASPAHPFSGQFDESRGKQLLSAYGIACPRSALCRTRDDALHAFRSFTKPVVLKIAADDIPHKTEVGGVVVGVASEQQLVEALDRIAKIPTSDPGKVLLEEMAPKGAELIVGGVRDASWGPLVMVGLGGVFAEILADTAIALVPVNALQASDMIDRLRGKRLLSGFRDLPPLDVGAVAKTISALSRLMGEHPEIAEIEINPLRVTENGVLALDALVKVG